MPENYINFKWKAVTPHGTLLITDTKDVYYMVNEDDSMYLKPELNNGCTCWRIPGTSRRYGKRTINKLIKEQIQYGK